MVAVAGTGQTTSGVITAMGAADRTHCRDASPHRAETGWVALVDRRAGDRLVEVVPIGNATPVVRHRGKASRLPAQRKPPPRKRRL